MLEKYKNNEYKEKNEGRRIIRVNVKMNYKEKWKWKKKIYMKEI